MTIKPLTDEMRSSLEATHGTVHTVSLPRHPHVTVAFVEMTRAQFEAFVNAGKLSRDIAVRRAALERCVRSAVVYPSGGQLLALARRFPEFLDVVGSAVIDVTGRVKIKEWFDEMELKARRTRLGVER